MRVLVSGGAGFIGSNYVRGVIEGKFSGITSLVVLDKLTYAGNRTNIKDWNFDCFEFFEGDINDHDLLSEILTDCDAVVNFAAESHVDRSIVDSREFVITNIVGTHSILSSALRHGVRTVVQVSTDEVYGSIESGSWDENYCLRPNSPYAASKASADLLSISFYKTHGLDVRITRSSNNYGPYQYPEKLIPRFITNLIDGKKIPLYGSGKNVRDWLHVEDNCEAIHKVLLSGKPGNTYNISGNDELTNLEITRKILNIMGKDETWIEFVPDRKGHDQRYSLNSEFIHRELQFSPIRNITSELPNLVDWYKSHETWWRPLVEDAKL